jgi:hypothetical protein
MTAAELSAVDRGEAVARVLDTERQQVAVVGAVRVRARRERILDRYRDVESLAASRAVLEVGRFSRPPRPADLQPLAFEEYDLAAVRECEPGDCAVRLSGDAMARFQRGVKWSAPGWKAEAAGVWRDVLADHAATYAARGDAGLSEYHNKETPLRIDAEFRLLFGQSRALASLAPEFLRYLQEYPRRPLGGAEDVLYWSKEEFGLKPVTSISHLALWAPPGSADAFVGTKRIYATHYFDAGLGFTAILGDGAGGSYIVSVSRVRTRSLGSFFRSFVRSTVQGRSREGVEKMLRSTKAAVER